jgi:hypothetical protein
MVTMWLLVKDNTQGSAENPETDAHTHGQPTLTKHARAKAEYKPHP